MNDLDFTNQNSWFKSLPVRSNPLPSRSLSQEMQTLDNRINWEINTQYAGTAGMFNVETSKWEVHNWEAELI